MLFSEPKIPQYYIAPVLLGELMAFQCSSASRKFLNGTAGRASWELGTSFSALQRAENSSMYHGPGMYPYVYEFQCSSASRKFLNTDSAGVWYRAARCFSALQRAENSSIFGSGATLYVGARFSALQRAENSSI